MMTTYFTIQSDMSNERLRKKMNRQWVERKNKEKLSKIAEQKNRIINDINNCTFLNDEVKKKLIECVNEYEKEPYRTASRMSIILMRYAEDVDEIELSDIDDFVESLDIDNYIMNLRYCSYNMYLDSELVEFDGDLLITDPCYIVKDRDESTRPKWGDYMRLNDYRGMSEEERRAVGYYEDYARMRSAMDKWDEENPDDWDVCECGHNMEAIGLTKCMTRSTIYGDWSCTVFNLDTKQPIGKFCADASMVGVFDLSEVLSYNQDYDDYIEKDWVATVIKNFKGTVQFIVEENKRANGDRFNVKVVGRGVNNITGEPLNFITSQTGL